MTLTPGEVTASGVAIGSSVRRRRLLLRWGWASLAAAFASLFPMGLWIRGAALLFIPLLVVSGLSFLFRLGVGSTRSAKGEGAVTFDGAELAIRWGVDRERRVRIRDLVNGYLLEPSTVVLELSTGEDVAITCADERAARGLLEHLGLSAATSVLRVPLLSPADRSSSFARIVALLALLLLPLIAFGLTIATIESAARSVDGLHLRAVGVVMGLAALAWGGLYAALRFVAPQAVLVGADGVAIERWGRPRFVSFADVARVERTLHGLGLVLEGGGTVQLRLSFSPIDPIQRASEEARDRREALLRRVEDARAAAGKSGVATAKLASLERRGRSMETWRDELRALPSREGGYRSATIEPEELVRVAEDGMAGPERRIGAVLALGGARDPALDARVRVAIDTCVDVDMKRALAEAAEGELDEAVLRRVVDRSRD